MKKNDTEIVKKYNTKVTIKNVAKMNSILSKINLENSLLSDGIEDNKKQEEVINWIIANIIISLEDNEALFSEIEETLKSITCNEELDINELLEEDLIGILKSFFQGYSSQTIDFIKKSILEKIYRRLTMLSETQELIASQIMTNENMQNILNSSKTDSTT